MASTREQVCIEQSRLETDLETLRNEKASVYNVAGDRIRIRVQMDCIEAQLVLLEKILALSYDENPAPSRGDPA